MTLMESFIYQILSLNSSEKFKSNVTKLSPEAVTFVDDETAYFQFINFVYRKYLTPKQTYNFGFQRDDLYTHYDFHHNRSIQELFDQMKNYTRSQNSDLFHNKVHNDLIYFVYSICDYDDKMINDDILDDLHEDERFEYEMYTDNKQ